MDSFKTDKADGYKDSIQERKLNNSHEKSLVVEQNKHEKELLDKKNTHEINLKDKDLGWLGSFFGGKELTALNISGTLIILLIMIGVLLTWKILNKTDCQTELSVKEVWAIFTPIITLTLGYLFGKK